MCLAKAYLEEQGKRELLLEEVALIQIEDNRLLLSTIFGERREVEADIKEIDFQNSRVVLEKSN